MKIILISNKIDKVRTLSLNSWAKCALSVLLLGIPVTAGTMLGIKIADGRWELLFDNSIAQMQNEIVLQREDVDAGRQQLDNSLSGMTLKLAKMRSRLVRLDALGEQLTQIASLEDGEFDFLLHLVWVAQSKLLLSRSLIKPKFKKKYQRCLPNLMTQSVAENHSYKYCSRCCQIRN